MGSWLGFSVGLLNLWLPFALGYGLIWSVSSFIGRRLPRTTGAEGEYGDKRLMYLFGFYPFLALALVSFFIPLNFGPLFRPGLLIFALGIILNILTVISLSALSGPLKTGGLYRFSRNPMYVSDAVYLAGLILVSGAGSFASLVYILLTLCWLAGTHWCVLREEAFLERTYGQKYLNYKHKTPRYLFI